jgi:hypothetical protein
MAVWFMRWLQGTLCEQTPLFDADIATGARATQTPTKDRQDDALRARERALAFTHGGAII